MTGNCIRCGAVNPPSTSRGVKERKFCSKKCSHAAWVDAHPERRAAHVKKYDTSDHGKARREIWEEENADALKQQKHEYYEANKDRIIASVAEYAKENRESVNAYKLAWQKTEKGRKTSLQSTRRRIARKLNAPGSHTMDEFYDLCAEFEDHCLLCLQKHDRSKLTIDHVVPLCDGGSDGIENLQPLCMTCNRAKATVTMDYRPTFWWRGPSREPLRAFSPRPRKAA